MKKVFAFLSVFALMIAFVGFNAKSSVEADSLWVKDPTLSDNEIPMYIMNSIMTTFPNYYDITNGGDDKWQGNSRRYPWNETRLQVKQMDADGKYTGKEYAIYFSGSTTADSAGTGNNLLFYVLDDNGNPTLGRMDNGSKMKVPGIPMDPSLSHMRKNITGKDILIPDTRKLWTACGSDAGGNMYNRVLVFDGAGRMVRGEGNANIYAEAGTDGANETVFAPEYGYVNGKIEKVEADTVLDKVKEQKLDEDGSPVLDDNGDPVLVETDKDAYYYGRFVWEWVSSERFNSESFAGVNEVGYLHDGWDAMKWDYATYEEASDGYVCIAFTGGQSSTCNLTPAELEVYNATLAAAGKDAVPAATARKCISDFFVPVDGWSYDYGYLDQGKMDNQFLDMFTAGYYYGRTVDEEGKGMAAQKTFDFSAAPLYFTDKAINGMSYQLMEGQNTVEVLQGEAFHPATSIVYTGLSKYWATPNDLTSFKSDTKVLDLTIIENGVTTVAPKTGYETFDAMVDDLVKDLNEYIFTTLKGCTWNEETQKYEGSDGKGGQVSFDKLVKPGLDADGMCDAFNTTGPWYAYRYEVCDMGEAQVSFFEDAKMYAKWSWLYDYLLLKVPSVYNPNRTCSSPGNAAYCFVGFLSQSKEKTGWPASKMDWSNGAASEWLDPRSNLDMWNEYTIDTATASVDKNYVVTYKCLNTVTGNESELTITYVVVDEYTPILTVNKNELNFTPAVLAGKVTMPEINPYKFCTAYNGQYNGTLKGDDISYKVHYSSETLDFNAPVEGEHTVTARVYSASGAKYVEKKFTVSIEDMTAPRVMERNLTLGYGEYFCPEMCIQFAYDDVDGNLMNNDSKTWFSYTSKTKVDTSKPGSYNVEIMIQDKAGNETKLTAKVTVLAQQNLAGITDEVEALKPIINQQTQRFDDVEEALGSLEAKVDALANDVAALKAAANAKCGSKSAVLVELLAAASLLGVFLRKRH